MGQIIKIAKLKIQHSESILDGLVVPSNNLIGSSISTEESMRKQVFDYLSVNGESTFKQIGEALDARWETIENITRHDMFSTTGNAVSLRN
jgi:hypothetical protein